MAQKDKLEHFDHLYSDVRPQLDELLADVVNGSKGDPDPNESCQEALCDAICDILEREARKRELSVARMRGFVGILRSTFEDMINMQKKKRPGDDISYKSITRCIRTKKPAKEKES